MRRRRTSLRNETLPAALAAALSLACPAVSGAQSGSAEPVAVVEIGGEADRSLTEREWSIGPAAAVEVTPIENWLELEVGVSPLFRPHATEWTIDLLFKKPWTLSSHVEFMIGLGPEWIDASSPGGRMNALGLEAAPDFMFWPSAGHRLGWYLEPGYEQVFGPRPEHGLGMSGGLMLGVP